MGRLVIDGNSVYEIDEECARRRNLPAECGIEEYMNDAGTRRKEERGAGIRKKKLSDFENVIV